MKICLIAHLSEITGAGIITVNNAEALKNHNHEVTLIVPGNGPLVELAKSKGLNVQTIQNPQTALSESSTLSKLSLLQKRLSYVINTNRFLNRLNPDTIYISTTASIFPGIAALPLRKKIVWHVNEVIDNPTLNQKIKKWFIRTFSDGILYDSETGKKYFPPKNNQSNLVVNNYTDVYRIKSLTATQSPNDHFTIISNGLVHRKGADILLKAAILAIEKQPDFSPRIHFVGPNDGRQPEFQNQLQELSQDKNLEGRVFFLGLKQDVPAEMKKCDLFISPSRNEARPMVVIEAMAAKIPVIATDVGDCKIVLKNGELGLVVPPENPEKLSEAIINVWKNQKEAKERAEKAEKQVFSDYGTPEFWTPLNTFFTNMNGN